ncbi:MAG: response regulator transcription factor [Deltaproteobacteria bacterium]|nr:response regulator transcription factor [Deltaproteobacteria bacterium]
MLRILIADDHPIVRRGLKQILCDEPDVDIVGEAQSADEVLALAETQNWDAVILDITMPGRGGLDTLEELKRRYPDLPVLMLSMHPEDQYAARAFKAGASGYMTKESALDELVKAIRKITKGGRYVSEAFAERLVAMMGEVPPSQDNLSVREFQVMLMIASGKTLSQIAVEMALSIKTISTYRTRILEKMQMKSNAEMTHYVIKNGLVK